MKKKTVIIDYFKNYWGVDLGCDSDTKYLTYLKKSGLPSLARLLKKIHENENKIK